MPPMVLIEWEDCARLDEGPWVPNVPIKKADAMLFSTVGFLLFKDEERVIVTGTYGDDLTGPRDQIPLGWIRKFVVLKETRSAP